MKLHILFIINFLITFVCSEIIKRGTIDLGNLTDLNSLYFWQFIIYSNTSPIVGGVNLGHYYVVGIPYYDSSFTRKVPYEEWGMTELTPKITGGRLRIELFYTPDNNPLGRLTGSVETHMRVTSKESWNGVEVDRFRSGGATVDSVVKKYIGLTGPGSSFRDTERYFLVGNNCQNFAKDLLSSFRKSF